MFVLSLIALKSKVLRFLVAHCSLSVRLNGKRIIRASEPTCWGPVGRPCLRRTGDNEKIEFIYKSKDPVPDSGN